MFTANLPVTLATVARSVLHTGPAGYGLLSAIVAVGSVTGALISARQRRTRLRTLMLLAALLCGLYLMTAAAPIPVVYPLLLGIGASTILLYTSANSTVQLATTDAIRGRIMSIYLLAFYASAAIGGPLLGAVDQHLGPRTGLLLAGCLPAGASLLIAARLATRVRRDRRPFVPALAT